MQADRLLNELSVLGFEVFRKSKNKLVAKTDLCRKTSLLLISDHFNEPIVPAANSSIGGVVVDGIEIVVKSKNRTNSLDVENFEIQNLRTQIKQFNKPINISVGDILLRDVVDVQKTYGTPKTDFHLVDYDGNIVYHISHKKGSTPRCFQQYGGLTEHEIFTHQETQQFLDDFLRVKGKSISNRESFMRDIKDESLKLMSIYGVDSVKGVRTFNSVDSLFQGSMLLEPRKKSLELLATGSRYIFPELPKNEFRPVLSLIYKGDRNQFGISGARGSIYPAGGRPFTGQI